MTSVSSPPAPPSAAELLDAWERATGQPAWARPLTLLEAVRDEPYEVLAALPIGSRDARLLAFRETVFGAVVAATADCPRCGEVAEFDVPIDLLASRSPSSPTGSVMVDGRTIGFRLPTTGDLSSVVEAAPTDAGRATTLLLERCVDPADRVDLDQRHIDAVIAAMEAADPVAGVMLTVECPGCRLDWSAHLDIAAFVWNEVDAWAERLLIEVDVLARAYGWTEPDVLALSPWRRRRYVDLAST